MKLMRLTWIVLETWLVAACGPTAPPFDLAAARKTIEDNNARFTKAHVDGDVATIDGFFTKDARSLPPDMNPVIGLPAIHDLNVQFVKFGISEFTEHTTSLDGNERLLVEQGDYTMVYGKEHTAKKGKYLNVWKSEQDKWKIQTTMWNASPSAPAAS